MKRLLLIIFFILLLVPANLDAFADHLIPKVADLAIDVNSGGEVFPGDQNNQYRIDITNNGPDSISGVLLNINLQGPGSLTGFIALGNTFNCTFTSPDQKNMDCTSTSSTFISGTTKTIFPEFNVDSNALPGETFTHTVTVNVIDTVVLGHPQLASDPNPANDMDSSVGPTVNGPVSTADLSITISDTIFDPTSPGGFVRYTITASNAGPDTAENVEVTTSIPNELSFLSTTCPNGAFTCELGDILEGGSPQYTLTLFVDNNANGVLSTDVSVTSDTTDPDLSNNSDDESTDVLSPSQEIIELLFLPGTDVVVEAGINMNGINTVEATFPDVPPPGGTLTFDFGPQPPLAPPGGFNINGEIFSITTDIPGPFELIINYNDMGLTQEEELGQTLQHFNEVTSEWEDQTTSVDTVADDLQAIVVLASPFGLFLPDNAIIGGEIIPTETTSLLIAGVQSFSWMIPVTLSILGFGLFAVTRKPAN